MSLSYRYLPTTTPAAIVPGGKDFKTKIYKEVYLLSREWDVNGAQDKITLTKGQSRLTNQRGSFESSPHNGDQRPPMKGTINFVEEHIRKIKRGNNVRGVITGGRGVQQGTTG